MNTMTKVAISSLLACTLLVGCAVQPVAPTPADYRLPEPAAGGTPLLLKVMVSGPSWLMTRDMAFRDAGEPGRQRSFAASRWQASPPELLEHYLGRSLTADGASGHCRLLLELDEFYQDFAADGSSQGVLSGRAVLLAPAGKVLARHAFGLRKPSATADARGGVAALGAAASALSVELSGWLGTLHAEKSCSDR